MKLIENIQTVKTLRQAGFKVHVSHERFTTGAIIAKEDIVTNGITYFHKGEKIITENRFKLIPEYDVRQKGYSFLPNGGKTTVTVTRLADGANFAGEAICSAADPFNRKLGVSIALGRLQGVAKENK